MRYALVVVLTFSRCRQRQDLQWKMAAINPAELQRGIDRVLRERWRLGRQGEKLTEDAG